MIVYITTNTINGKKYIGKDEKNDSSYLGSGLALNNAIKKYGRKNFCKEILCYARDKKDLNELEIYYIDYYNAQKSTLFYNIAKGGTGGDILLENQNNIPIYEINPSNFDIIEKYISGKEAAKKNNLPYRELMAVVEGKNRLVRGRLFLRVSDYNKDKLINSYLPSNVKNIYKSHISGKVFFKAKELWESEFKDRYTFNTFKIYMAKGFLPVDNTIRKNDSKERKYGFIKFNPIICE